jgi:hypothetical protein
LTEVVEALLLAEGRSFEELAIEHGGSMRDRSEESQGQKSQS